VHNPRVVNLVCAASFYEKKDTLGTLVFKDAVSKGILIWEHMKVKS